MPHAIVGTYLHWKEFVRCLKCSTWQPCACTKLGIVIAIGGRERGRKGGKNADES